MKNHFKKVNAMEKNIMDKQGFKKFLQLYNRFVYSIINQNNGCELEDEIITDEEIDWLYNVYQEVEGIKQKKLTPLKAIKRHCFDCSGEICIASGMVRRWELIKNVRVF